MYDINLVMSTLKIFDAIFVLGKDDERLNFIEQWFAEWGDMMTDTPFDSSKQSITSVVVDTSETTAFSYFMKKLIAIE